MKHPIQSLTLFVSLLCVLTSARAAVPACTLDRGADDAAIVSLPASLSPKLSSIAWTLNGLPLDDTTRSITLHVSPWDKGTFVVTATRANGARICTRTIRQTGIRLDRQPYVEPYPTVAAAPHPKRAVHRVRAAAPPTTADTDIAQPSPPRMPMPPPPMPLAAAAPPPPDASAIIKVYFATEREPKPGPAIAFTGSRSRIVPLRYGTATVTIPPNHKAGSIELRRWWSLSHAPDSSRHFTASLALCTEDSFYAQIRTQITHYTGHKEIFVFIHGFNNSFDEELYRTAQLAHDIGFDGAPIMYDWPSWGETLRYPADERSIGDSVHPLRDFLKDITRKTGADKVSLIAHSLGNYGMLQALDLLRSSGDLPQLDQIIMAAPDVDTKLFDDIVPSLVASGKIGRITMYSSHKDLAMKASFKENKVYPVGGQHPIAVLANVDSIDVSPIEMNWIGHDYFVTATPVLMDIGDLLRDGTPPPRSNLVEVPDTPLPHWTFRTEP